MESTLVGVVNNEERAHQIINELRGAGFSVMDTSLLFAGSEELAQIARKHESKRTGGAAAGLGAGAIAGGLGGLLLALTIFDVPEAGVLVALGPIVVHIADALAGLAGGAVGAVAGALIGLRAPDHAAKFYEAAVDEGKFLLSVHTEDPVRVAAARRIFEKNEVEEISEIK
jgi:hypothetical protein